MKEGKVILKDEGRTEGWLLKEGEVILKDEKKDGRLLEEGRFLKEKRNN